MWNTLPDIIWEEKNNMENYKSLDFLGEQIYESTINTLRTYYIPKKGFAKSYAILTADYGSADVEFSVNGGKSFRKYPEGIAHFLEHKVFEMPGGENVFNRFTEMGASVNAFTNHHQTSYYFSTTDNFAENLALLLQMVTTPYLTPENVEKEKGIIAEEIKMYDDHPGFRGFIETVKALYQEHPVREDIAGSVASIYSLTPQDLLDCYEAFYNPRNLILVLVGDLEPEQFEAIIRANVKPGKPQDLVKKTYGEPPHSVKKSSVLDMGLQVPNYIYGFKVPGTPSNLLEESLVGSLMMRLVFGDTSTFYEESLRSGLINDSFSTEISLEVDHGEIFLGGESREPEKTMQAIEAYIDSVLADPQFFLQREMDMIRIKKAMTGSFMNLFNSVDAIGKTVTGMILHEEELFSYIDTLKKIHISQVETKFRELFQKDRSTQVIIR